MMCEEKMMNTHKKKKNLKILKLAITVTLLLKSKTITETFIPVNEARVWF